MISSTLEVGSKVSADEGRLIGTVTDIDTAIPGKTYDAGKKVTVGDTIVSVFWRRPRDLDNPDVFQGSIDYALSDLQFACDIV
jgi:hypothetical protein|tara:strand:- start:333 stop:581 length:249 start_codon:yes stop_codon:yes gene_type:complete